MRTLIVVYINDFCYSDPGIRYAVEVLVIEPFAFQDSVHTLSYSVFSRIPALSHAYQYPVVLQQLYILLAAVLAAAVRVVDEAVEPAARIADGHPQCLHRVVAVQRRAERPAEDLLGVCVCNKMKVRKAAVGVYVGYVPHPYLVGRRRDDTTYQIGPLPHPPAAVGGADTAALPVNLKMLSLQQVEEAVTPDGDADSWTAVDEFPQFPAADPTHVLAVFLNEIQDNAVFGVFPIVVVELAVIGLPGPAKQCAELLQSALRSALA